MHSSGDQQLGAWRLLLGVDDAAALRRALLAKGRERRAAGDCVLVGCFEPPQPGPELDGLSVLPLLPDEDRRVDLAAIRERRPDVVLLDDLARLTPPEAERIPDVDAIRSLGIEVISTLRATQIRSLARQTSPAGPSAPTVPERALLEVDSVEVIAPDHTSELAAAAHRWAGRHQRSVRRARTDDAWSGRIVVAFDATRDAGDVVERAANLARGTGAHLVGARVTRDVDDRDEEALRDRQRQLEALDADVVEVVDDDPGWALARVAEAEGARVVVQRGTVEGRLLLDTATAAARGLDLYLVAPAAGQVDLPPVTAGASAGGRPPALSRARRAAGYIAAAVAVPLLTFVLALFRPSVHLSTVLLLLLALSVAVTALGGRGPGLLAAVGGFALGDYWFTHPYFEWVIDDPNVIIAMIVFVVVATLVSVLVDVAARRGAEAARARAEATALAHLASAVLASPEPLPRLLHDLRAVFRLDAVAILRRDGDGWVVEHALGSPVPQRPADAIDALAIGPHRYLALVGPHTPAEDSRVLAAFTAQLALVTDRRGGGTTT